MWSVVTTGRTVEEALEAALARLGAERHQVEVEVLEQPARGLWSWLNPRPARVRVSLKVGKADAVAIFLRGLCARIGVHAEVRVEEDSEAVRAELVGQGLGRLIGRRGTTLDALQYLTHVATTRLTGDPRPVVVDVDGYRREEEQRRLARRLAQRVRRTGKPITLRPMSARERRIVHLALRDDPRVRTESVGEEPFRKVVIRPHRTG